MVRLGAPDGLETPTRLPPHDPCSACKQHYEADPDQKWRRLAHRCVNPLHLFIFVVVMSPGLGRATLRSTRKGSGSLIGLFS